MISFTKHPTEKISKGFTPDLETGVTVSSCTVTAIDHITGAANTAVISSATATLLNTNTAYAVFCQAGEHMHDYLITFTATCSDGQILVEKLLMMVRGE